MVILEKQDELKQAALLLVKFLCKYYDPHTYAIVNENRVEIVRGEMSIIFPVQD